MIITGTLMKRAMAGELPLLGAIKQISDELMERRGRGEEPEGLLGAEAAVIDNMKKLTLFVAGVAAQKYLDKLGDQQELLAWIADMIMQTFAMESAWLRTLRLADERDGAELEARCAAVRFAVEQGAQLIAARARSVIAAAADGEEMRSVLSMARKLWRREPFDLVAAGHTVAAYCVEREGYPFV
jgi:butyryl-CoA dehydrogenase